MSVNFITVAMVFVVFILLVLIESVIGYLMIERIFRYFAFKYYSQKKGNENEKEK